MILLLLLGGLARLLRWVVGLAWALVAWTGRRVRRRLRSAHRLRGALVLVLWLLIVLVAVDVVVAVVRQLVAAAWDMATRATSNVLVDIGVVLLVLAALITAEVLLRLARRSASDEPPSPQADGRAGR